VNGSPSKHDVTDGGITSISPESQHLLKLATYASVAVAVILIICKTGAWLVTDSVSLLSTLIDSLLDVLASIVNLIAIRHALQPADREHRFGHGKAEPLAGLAQSAFISGSAVFLLLQSVERLIWPREISSSEIGIVVMVVSIVLTLGLVGFQRYVIAKTASVAIKADSLHYQTDILVNLSVIISLLLASKLGWDLADPIFAIGIVAYIVWGAFGIGRSSLDLLMDHELPDEDRIRIREIALSHNGVVDIHDLRTRSSGQQSFIQLHLEMDGNISLFDAHEISDSVEISLQEAFPTSEVLIHEDPEGVEEHRAEFQ
jgi:ferrous-iron efflux pump FieF